MRSSISMWLVVVTAACGGHKPPHGSGSGSADSAAICQNCGTHGGGTGGGTGGGKGGGTSSSPPRGCPIGSGTTARDKYFNLFVVSPHHGAQTGNAPTSGDLTTAAQLFESLAPLNNEIVAMPAGPPGNAFQTNYTQFATDFFIDRVQDDSGFNARAITTQDSLPYDPTRHGDTAVGITTEWTVIDAHSVNFPSGIAGNEGMDYGSFRLQHKSTGFQIVILAATVDDGGSKQTQQIAALVNAGKATSDTWPTFIAADLNICLDEATPGAQCSNIPNNADVAAVRSMILKNTKPINYNRHCSGLDYVAFDASDGAIINLLLVNGTAASTVDLRYVFFDPNKPRVNGKPAPSAGNIVLVSRGLGISANHPAIGFTFVEL